MNNRKTNYHNNYNSNAKYVSQLRKSQQKVSAIQHHSGYQPNKKIIDKNVTWVTFMIYLIVSDYVISEVNLINKILANKPCHSKNSSKSSKSNKSKNSPPVKNFKQDATNLDHQLNQTRSKNYKSSSSNSIIGVGAVEVSASQETESNEKPNIATKEKIKDICSKTKKNMGPPLNKPPIRFGGDENGQIVGYSCQQNSKSVQCKQENAMITNYVLNQGVTHQQMRAFQDYLSYKQQSGTNTLSAYKTQITNLASSIPPLSPQQAESVQFLNTIIYNIINFIDVDPSSVNNLKALRGQCGEYTAFNFNQLKKFEKFYINDAEYGMWLGFLDGSDPLEPSEPDNHGFIFFIKEDGKMVASNKIEGSDNIANFFKNAEIFIVDGWNDVCDITDSKYYYLKNYLSFTMMNVNLKSRVIQDTLATLPLEIKKFFCDKLHELGVTFKRIKNHPCNFFGKINNNDKPQDTFKAKRKMDL